MKKTLTLSLLVLGCAAHADVAMAGCREAYMKTPYVVDAKTKWTYFEDVVAEISEEDGKTLVAFQKRSKRFELPANADAKFLAALKASLEKSSKIHIAVDATGGTSGPKPGAVAADLKLDRILWASAEKQHESCR